MTEPEQTPPDAVASTPVKPPNLAVGMGLLGLAAVLIVVVLINPSMPGWLRVVVAVLSVLVVAVLGAYAVVLFRAAKGDRR